MWEEMSSKYDSGNMGEEEEKIWGMFGSRIYWIWLIQLDWMWKGDE